MVNSFRPLFVYMTRGTIAPEGPAQILSPSINVELVASQKVFGRHEDRITSYSILAAHRRKQSAAPAKFEAKCVTSGTHRWAVLDGEQGDAGGNLQTRV